MAVAHPVGLVFLGADEADRMFAQPLGREVGGDVGRPAMLVIGDLGRRVVRGLILDGGFDDIGHAGIPFGSSAVEASIVGARSRGVSTSLDTKGFVLFGATLRLDRKSGGQGQSVYVRLDPGGGR